MSQKIDGSPLDKGNGRQPFGDGRPLSEAEKACSACFSAVYYGDKDSRCVEHKEH